MANPALNENFNENQVKALQTLGADFAAATTTSRGVVLRAANQANVTPATDGTAVGTAFNLLLTNLRAAGIVA